MSKCDYWGYKYLVSAKVLKPNSAISNLKTSKEEKKMRKKAKVNGHVVHKLPKCDNLYYTVEPENGRIAVHELIYHVVDWGNNWENNKYEPHYYEYSYIHIYPNKLGKHGYLQERLEAILDSAPVRDYLEREKMFNTFAGALSVRKEDLKALNDTIFEEEKKMIEYYVIDVDMTLTKHETKDMECLQIRQSGNYFEIPFDAPDCSEYRLDRLERCLHDYILDTNKRFRVSLEKSEICSNSVLKITTPYGDISDDANREELCKMLTYAAEHGEYPNPTCHTGGLSKIRFCLRECNNREIYKKAYSVGIDCDIRIRGRVARNGDYLDYIPAPTDVTELRFKNGRLTHFMAVGNPGWEEAASGKIPGALYYIYHHSEPFQNVDEVKSLLGDAYDKRAMWRNASYIIFSTLAN